LSSVVGTGTGAFSATTASSFLQAASGSTRHAASARVFISFMVVLRLKVWNDESGGLAPPFGLQGVGHRGRDEARHVAAEPRDLAHQRRRNEPVFLGR